MLLAPPPTPFVATVARVSAADLGPSWHPGCPVGPSQLRLVRLSYWGFDRAAHTGELIVHEDATRAIVGAFRRLFAARFPIRRMETVDKYGANDRRSMAADNTSAFNCRYASAPGPKRWSAHAYGKAIDVNTIENPYVQGDYVSPPAGRRFTDRTNHRPGMAWAGGALVRAFANVGWQWGGYWRATPDYQHFSASGG
jgi:D-alanyl-D-alanine carboxypeptidase